MINSIFSHTNSFFNSKTYRLGDIVVDPGDVWVFEGVKDVLLTHAHFDHIYGLNELLRISPLAKVYTNEIGKEMLLDARKNMSFYHETPYVFEYPEAIVIIKDGDEITLSKGFSAKAVFTPGHNPSCITWIIGNSMFTGDSYIPGIKTVTNLPGGNKTEAKKSESTILSISSDLTIYPGHSVSAQIKSDTIMTQL